MDDSRLPKAQDEDVEDAFRAVMQGLRLTLPGVQVLFAFLLTLPLQAAFGELETFGKGAYFVAFSCSAVASILLIAPSAHQRFRAPATGVYRRSERHLAFTVRLTIVGTLFSAVAMGASVYLVAFLVLGSTIGAAVATAAIALLIGWAWMFIPLVTFRGS